jgi:hypothetical protein
MLSGNKLFLIGKFNEHERMIFDTICMSDMNLSEIFDKTGTPTAQIKPDGTIESTNGIPYLYIKAAIDKKLSAFFFMFHYLPQKQTIQIIK